MANRFSGRRVIAIYVVITTVVAVLAVGAVTIGAVSVDSFRPAGSMRMATAVNNNSVSVIGSDGDVKVLSVKFTVPAGQVADIAANYNATVSSEDLGQTVGLCFGAMRLDNEAGPDLAPGGRIMLTKGVDAGSGFYTESRSIQVIKNGIPFGSHILYVMAYTGGGGCYYSQGSLLVTADLH